MGDLYIRISSGQDRGQTIWYWEMININSNEVSCYSIYFTCLEGAVRAAKAFIYNMNQMHIVIINFDEKIKPNTSKERNDIPFEKYFNNLCIYLENEKQKFNEMQQNPVEENKIVDGLVDNINVVPFKRSLKLVD